jgi:hypothetical protein
VHICKAAGFKEVFSGIRFTLDNGKVFMRRIFLAAMLLLISGTAHAAGPAPATAPAQAQPTAPEATRIETDQKTGAVKIIVNNREVARFNAEGLQVRDAIGYGGMITDAGSSDAEYAYRIKPYAERIKARPKH